jgi:uncharacterized protein
MVISEAIVHHYGRDDLPRRLAHLFWFQSFGAAMSMDWHSSRHNDERVGRRRAGHVHAWRAGSRFSQVFCSLFQS